MCITYTYIYIKCNGLITTAVKVRDKKIHVALFRHITELKCKNLPYRGA